MSGNRSNDDNTVNSSEDNQSSEYPVKSSCLGQYSEGQYAETRYVSVISLSFDGFRWYLKKYTIC